MNAVNNYVAVPFFDRVPPRANAIVLSTFDSIVEKGVSVKEAYHFFANSVKHKGIEGPAYTEFEGWYARVKNGLIDRPHPSEAIASINPYKPTVKSAIERHVVAQPMAIACAVDRETVDLDQLKQARSIVEAANHLFEAKIAAGHNPLSIGIDDTIVAEALRTLLEADGPGLFEDTTSNALDTALTLLQSGVEDDPDKLLDILTMDMQQELCRELVKRPPPQHR